MDLFTHLTHLMKKKPTELSVFLIRAAYNISFEWAPGLAAKKKVKMISFILGTMALPTSMRRKQYFKQTSEC